MMRNKFLASLNHAFVAPVKFLQGQKEQKANRSGSSRFEKTNANTFAGRPHNVTETLDSKLQQRRNMSSMQLKELQSIIAQTSQAEQKCPSSCDTVDEGNETFLDRNQKQSPHQMKTKTAVNQPTLNKYAKFRQRQEVTKELNCPPDTTKDAQGLFDWYAKNGTLDYESFGEIVVQIMKSAEQELSEEDMKKKIEVSWREVDRNYSGKVDFDEFAIWYSSWGFRQELLLSPKKILIRDFAKKYDLSIAEVDSVQSMFQCFDEDESGEIEFDEFKKLLYKLMKVPKGAELPATRLQHFWKEIDIDGSGSVCFAEFLQWYIKYFDMKGTSKISPIEQFYQSVRPNFGR